VQKTIRPARTRTRTTAPVFCLIGTALAAAVAAQPADDPAAVPLESPPVDVATVGPADLHASPLVPLPRGAAGLAADDPAEDLTDEDIETFARVYVDLEREARRYERAIAAADSEEEAQEIQARLQTASLAVLEKHGWSQEKFDRVARTLNARPDLAAEALRRIEEKN